MRCKALSIILFLCISLLLSGCSEILFTTAEYRTYRSFCDRHKAGTEKQDVYEKLGCPDGYVDGVGEYHHISFADRENAAEKLYAADAVIWVYECWKYSDPAEPYRLKVSFDSAGKSVEATMTVVPGG